MSKTEDWDELIESIKSLPVEEERTPMVRLWESEYERDLARPDMKLNENTIESISLLDVEKTANDEAGPLELEEMFQFQDPGFFAIREREISSELEKYLERCVMKYRDYSEGDIQLIKEMLISLFVLESVFLKNAQKENRHLGVFGRDLDDENDVVWKWRINTASDISKKPHEYLERLTICVDIKQRFPTIYNCILNKDFQAFSFLWEFLSREATYYRSIEVEDIIEDHDYKEVCRIIECKRLAELIQASDTSSFIEKCKDFIQNWKPKDIVAFLNQNIIAQENAKRTAAMALYSHVVRIIHPEIESKKRNYLFLGPTGTGKTEIFRQLARISPVEINIMDASSITSEGFLGLSKGDMLKTLKQRSKDGQFEYSVIVMDECDKLIRPEYNSEGENINESIQGDLLKMVEGGEIFTGNFSNGDIIDTENIMFIFTGAFVGLVNENEEKNVCGFLGGSSSANGKRDTIEKRLQSYGMIPELIGRISDFISLEKLTKEDYVQVLTNTKENALKGIRELYEAEDHINIDVSDEAIEAIAEKAVKQELGARQMANILERAVRNEVYWAMERGITDVLITRENISEN